MMFSKTTAPDPLPVKVVEVPAADLIPLSHLGLDLDSPPIGWLTYLSNIGVEILTDDLGRKAIHRHDARRLFDEHREAEARKAELRARQERDQIEADQRFRASLGQGVKVPAGMSYAEAVQQAELDAQTYRPRRRSLMEDLLSNDGVITYHPIQHEDEAS